MSMNILNDISQVYMEKVASKPDFLDLDKDGNKEEPMKNAAVQAPKERLKTDRNMFNIPKDEQKAARERLLAKARSKREKMEEALDPVGQEDDDPDNDGVPNDNNDKYILKRRKAIGKAISRKKVEESNYYDPMDDDEFDHNEAEENRGVSGKNNPKGGKSLIKKKKPVKEGFSNWRQDLSEVMDEVEANRKVKEKKVKNNIKTSAMGAGIKLGEAVEEIGGTLIEMVELDEGMTMKDFKNQRSRQKQKDKREALKTSPTRRAGIHADKASPERAARHRANVDPDFEGNDERNYPGGKLNPKKVRKAKALGELGEEYIDEKAYRGLGVGRVERVSSGSYKAPETTGSAAKRKPKPETKPVATQKPAALPPEQGRRAKKRRDNSPSYDEVKAQIDAREKSRKPKKSKRSRLDSLLASIRNEETQLDEIAPLAAGALAAGAAATPYLLNKFVKPKVDKILDNKTKKIQMNSYEPEGEVLDEKATSEQQQKLFGLALSVKRGETPRSEASAEVLKIVDDMSEKKIRDFAKTKHEGLPNKVEEEVEVINERRREDKGTPRPQRDRALEVVKGMIRQQTGTPAGQRKKVPGKKPPTAGQYGAPKSPAQKLKLRKAQQQRSQDWQQDTKGT